MLAQKLSFLTTINYVYKSSSKVTSTTNTTNTDTKTKTNNDNNDKYKAQKRKRINSMPWLYDIEKHFVHHNEWQRAWQRALMDMETIEFIGDDIFISDDRMSIFAEPSRAIVIKDHARIATNCYLHGPINVDEFVSINQGCHFEGGKKGISIGKNTRIGPNTSMFAFNHSFDCLEIPIREQKVSSRGIEIGEDVWIGANCSIVDGVVIGSSAVIGIASVVTKDVPEFEIWAGNPARKIGHRRKE